MRNRKTKYKSIDDSFNAKVKIIDTDDCIIWQYCRTAAGYGVFSFKKKVYYAHVYACNKHNPLMSGKNIVCHTCDNPCCCNPKHLYWGTNKENTIDMMKRGRNKYGAFPGELHPSAKLTEKKVIQIRHLLKNGKTQTAVAKIFGMSQSTIYEIKSGKIWRHILS